MIFGNFDEFFRATFGKDVTPFDYQQRLAKDPKCKSRLVDVPTGCGKTAAVVLAWLWNRVEKQRSAWPRRLVYCLPMRTLVEQTRDNVRQWLKNLGDLEWDGTSNHAGKIGVHILMGGEEAEANPWDLNPECNAILIGTQDMLLSRALNRGYGMSRYRWPMHFGLLNNDTLWVMDETQLMGVAVETSAQFDGFRHTERTGAQPACLTWWMSATLDEAQIETVDHPRPADGWPAIKLKDEDLALPVVRDRLNAKKKIVRATVTLNAAGKGNYAKSLAQLIAREHRVVPEGLTLVVVNNVRRAQEVYQHLKQSRAAECLALVHSRFRSPDRKAHEKNLHADRRRVVVATQAVEAGVDISARVLVTELAPWSSLVQRFGRCNRYGEFPDGADIFWINIKSPDEKNALALPYSTDELEAARKLLIKLGNDASPHSLNEKIQYEPPREIRPVIRRKDLVDLFDTTPDLAGNDLDISRYVRDSDDTDVQVYWRAVPKDELPGEDEPAPIREELCRVSIRAFGDFLQKKNSRVFAWNPLDEKWEPVKRARPGQVYLIDSETGGYSDELGWTGDDKDNLSLNFVPAKEEPDAMARDRESFVGKFIVLEKHTQDVVEHLEKLMAEFALDGATTAALRTAAHWHDVGKAHEYFQRWMTDGAPGRAGEIWGKSDHNRKPPRDRRGFRHELASALAWLQNAPADAPNADLIAFLIAAHHGKVRLSIRSLPNETPPPEAERLYARGVWDGDPLPGPPLEKFSVNSQTIPRFNLDLSLMRLGDGPCGPSWLARMVTLRDTLGPFRLGWLEMLLRVADGRASATETQPQQA
jgi:CRISPR-associated endonuclease/helicase Cas3